MKSFIKKKVAGVARFAAREMAAEFKRIEAAAPASATPDATKPLETTNVPIRIDAKDLVHQLSSGPLNQHLVHFFTWNHRWIAQLSERNRRAAVSTYDFVEAEMADAVFSINQFDVIASKADEMITLDGQILDLGVYKGASTRALARIFPDRRIHGFDSFEGLPGDWAHVLKGDFGDVAGALPDVPDNVSLWKGWFDDSLPRWIEQHGGEPISILRVDCDIYSSTKTIFDVLEPLITNGTWIVFDELIGLTGWERHEHKAFMEFIDRTGFEYSYIAYGLTYTIARLGPA